MDYLVEFIITIPHDAPPAEIEQRMAGETTRVAELAAHGHALRVWKPLPDDGRQRALGLYRAASDEELKAILNSLPLRPWMEISVTALAEHPNDPARSAAWPTARLSSPRGAGLRRRCADPARGAGRVGARRLHRAAAGRLHALRAPVAGAWSAEQQRRHALRTTG